MSKRWEPKEGEWYWMIAFSEVVQSKWCADSADLIRWQMGNCFKTKAEAEAAAEKVKALLLSLHEPTRDCNQLPKLTTEVFNREDCPKWATWAAVDKTGDVWVYSSKPHMNISVWAMDAGATCKPLLFKANASDWQNSLVERHVKETKLPEWCKVGEWVWATTFSQYFKIDRIDKLFIHGESSAGDSYSVKFENVRRARLRPYNTDEMRGSVGKVVTTSSGRHCTLVTACKQEYSVIEPQVMLNKWLYATDLLHGGNTIDGKPCGVFEHRENGEWVE